jgi:hypothetical protein
MLFVIAKFLFQFSFIVFTAIMGKIFRLGGLMSKYIEISGTCTHELPPLLVHSASEYPNDQEANLSSVMVEAEDMIVVNSEVSQDQMERQKYDLSVQMLEQYRTLRTDWLWGDSVLEWIRQCEITFESETVLRRLLHPDIWPHASRASFVRLLEDKGVPISTAALERAVGLRLTFRQPPPVDCFSGQFLFYLNFTVTRIAYPSFFRRNVSISKYWIWRTKLSPKRYNAVP